MKKILHSICYTESQDGDAQSGCALFSVYKRTGSQAGSLTNFL